MVVEDVIFFELRRVKIHVAARLIGIAGIEQLRDDLDILVDAAGRRLDDVWPLDVELSAVVKECIGVELCDFHDALVLAPCALEHLVFALVRVRGQVSHVRDVHDALNRVADVAQILFQHILHDIAAEIADVREVIDRGAAGVHFDELRVIGDKLFFFVRCGIIKIHVVSSCN